MWARFQDSSVRDKLIVLVCIVLALLVTLVCIVDLFLIRRMGARQPIAQPEIVQPATAEPKSIPTMAPPTQALPVVEITPTPQPVIVVPPPVTTWRFLRINAEDIGTFENVADPNQTLQAKCIDLKRPPPKKGEIYYLNDEGILKLASESKEFQRFKVIGGQ